MARQTARSQDLSFLSPFPQDKQSTSCKSTCKSQKFSKTDLAWKCGAVMISLQHVSFQNMCERGQGSSW